MDAPGLATVRFASMTPDRLPQGMANLLWGRALVAGLLAGGVQHAVVSPGSRSSPLVLALQEDARLAKHVQIDERSAAFLALGIAKATRTPVALVCTSGTAAANYLPAIAEARLAGVPLVALTADRPPELRDTGASQTIDQLELYGQHVSHFVDLPCPGDADADAGWWLVAARHAAEACARALSGAMGPVHLNVPFREPLVPAPRELGEWERIWHEAGDPARLAARAAFAAAVEPTRSIDGSATAGPPAATLDAIAGRIARAERPLLLAGPEAVAATDSAAVRALAQAAGMPLIADIASGLRSGVADDDALLCAHADLALRDEALAGIAPDFVLRLGGIPTSKVVATWLARHRPEVIAVQPDARRRDPDGVVRDVIVSAVADLCAALTQRLRRFEPPPRPWKRWLIDADRGARQLAVRAPHEAAAVVAACAALPAGGNVFLSSSMPIRWAEFYVRSFAPEVSVFVNRGANGIDGIVSTAIGVALATARPTLLVTGDLAYLHDAGGLRAARALRSPLVVLLLDNDGGGIFSHLPIVEHEDAFEAFFGTPQHAELAAVARMSGIEHVEADRAEDVSALAGHTLRQGGLRVVHWRSGRRRTLDEQRALAALPSWHAERVLAGELAWTVRSRGLAGRPLLLLHGFTASGEFWRPVAHCLPGWRCLAPDLPGHGGTDAPLPPEAWRLDRVADALAALLDALSLERCAVAGYSMGGRLALAFALRHPQRVSALALVGATPGIADARERDARAAADHELAAGIERDGVEAFAERWAANPLFATQASLPQATQAALRTQRLAQRPEGLAAALRAFGTGVQPPLHARLPALGMPVLWMAGALDTKFAAVAASMAARAPRGAHCLVADAGHAVPLERPLEFARELERFLEHALPEGSVSDPEPG